MAQRESKPTTRKRVGDYNPDLEVGETLDPIANTEVNIFSVTFDGRTGKKGPYILAIIEAGTSENREDASLYHTGGQVVVERLAALFGIPSLEVLQSDFIGRGIKPDTAADTFPVLAVFSKEKSASNPGQSYWTVS